MLWLHTYYRQTKMWCELVEFAVISLIVIQFIRFVLADADLTLLFKVKFGKKPDVLRGDVVWITGASSGIGEYLAYDLARAGCKLILSARREERLNRVKQQCLTQGITREEDIMVLPLDLVALDSHARAVIKVLEKFSKIDILVNNSGRGQLAWAVKTELAVDREIMELNFFGTLSLTKLVLPHMQNRKRGHIVVTSSMCGKSASPLIAAYSATKFALQGWFDTLRLEASSDNIHVTMVCPGPVVSDIADTLLTDKVGKKPPRVPSTDHNASMMSTERCAELMTVAMANKLDEVWLMRQPVLTLIYLAQYMPRVYTLLMRTVIMKYMVKITKRFLEG